MLCIAVTTIATAQQRQIKMSKSIDVPKDVTIDLNTSHVNIEIETWNKGVLEIEAYVESDELSAEELKEAAENWNLELEAFEDFASIKSSNTERGLWSNYGVISSDYTDALIDLQLNLADLPALPQMPEMPEMPNMPQMPEMPEMPAMPALPKLPEGVTSVSFDYEAYKEGGEVYLEKWSQEYEEKYGKEYKEKMKVWAKEFSKTDFDSYSKRMEAWGEKFGKSFEGKWEKDMEKWGEEFGKRFEGDWAEKMEKWGEEFGEKFGKDIEKWGEEFGERFGKDMEKWGEQFARQFEDQEEHNGQKLKLLEERKAQLEGRRESLLERTQKQSEEHRQALLQRSRQHQERGEKRKEELFKRLESRRNLKVKRTLKIKMPKDAELKMNVRHGKLKFASLIKNLKADLAYSTLLATHIDGIHTSINVSYSDVNVTNWNAGDLNLKYVENAMLRQVKQLSLNAISSNIDIDDLTGTAIIDGSFGDLAIHNVSESFSNLNIILENSDATIQLPNTDYNLLFKGDRSKFNNERVNRKAIKNYPENGSTDKTILVNAKYSNVVMQ